MVSFLKADFPTSEGSLGVQLISLMHAILKSRTEMAVISQFVSIFWK